jgi:plasmid stability protein
MATIIVRNLSEEARRALKARAAQHGLSMEAEARAIIEDAVKPAGRRKLGDELAQIGRRYGGWDLEIERDQTPVRGADFSESE